jgi:hypothetical protein
MIFLKLFLIKDTPSSALSLTIIASNQSVKMLNTLPDKQLLNNKVEQKRSQQHFLSGKESLPSWQTF